MSTTATLSPFGPLVLPTRRRPSGRATFQVGSREDDDDDSPDESPENNTHNDDDDDRGQLPPFHLKKSFHRPIPFPRTSPLPSSTHTENKKEQSLSPLTTTTTAAADTGTAAARSPRPSVSRTSSTPVSMFPHHPHLIVSTTFSSASADSSPCASPLSSSTATSPVVPPQKNVHFASQEEGGLASLLCTGDEIDRKTEGEGPSAPTGFSGRPSAYPFLNPNTVPRPTVYPPQSKSMDPLRHHPELGSQSPVTHPQDIQYSQSESNPVKRPDDEPPSPGGDLNLQLKEHTGAELALVSLSTLTFFQRSYCTIQDWPLGDYHPWSCLLRGARPFPKLSRIRHLTPPWPPAPFWCRSYDLCGFIHRWRH